MPLTKSLRARLWLRGCLFYGDHFPIRQILKVKTWPDLFRKHWLRARELWIGARAKQFFVIANVTSPAVLIEGGFLTNKEDISKVASEDYREQLAAAVTDGILRYRDTVKQRQSTLAVTASGKALNRQKVRPSK